MTREIMSKERFENDTNWKMTYEEYKKCYCPDCDKEGCPHREAFRRVPKIDGGLGLCPNLNTEKKEKICLYKVYEEPKSPTEYGKYIGSTPIEEQAFTVINEAKRNGKNYFIKYITEDGRELY